MKDGGAEGKTDEAPARPVIGYVYVHFIGAPTVRRRPRSEHSSCLAPLRSSRDRSAGSAWHRAARHVRDAGRRRGPHPHGAGAAGHVIRAAINNYGDYGGVRTPGAFTVSVYAAIGGITEQMIVEAMPQRQYGVATYGDLRREFELWPTTDLDADLDKAIKEVHFDIVLPDGGLELPSGAGYDDHTDEQLAATTDQLAAPVEALLARFLPRRSK